MSDAQPDARNPLASRRIWLASLPGRDRPRGRVAARYAITVAILLLGATLRLVAFDETLIEPDQAAILDAAFQTATLRYFPLTGMKSSVGVMQTGIVPLLASLPLLFVKRIIAVQWFFSALDLLALAWLHRAVRQAVGWRAAAIAALLYATAPWVVLYARTIWYQTLIASLATVAFGSLLVLLSPRPAAARLLPLAMGSVTALGMVHLAAAPWSAILMLLCLAIAWRKHLGRAFLIGLMLSGLIAVPYLIHLVRASFSDIAFILSAGRASSVINTAAYRLASELVSGSMIVANAHGDLWDRSVITWPAAHTMALVILAAAFAWAVVTVATAPRSRPMALLMAVWTLAVPALFLRSDVHLQHFYLMGLFPAPFVLVGACVGDLTTPGRRSALAQVLATLARLAAALLALIALWWASLWVVRAGLEARGELERDTRGWLMDLAAEAATAFLQEEPDGSLIVLADYEGEASAFEWLRGVTQSNRVRVVPVGKGFIIPSGPTCYLLGPHVSRETLWPVPDFVERPELQIPANPPWSMVCGQRDAPGGTPRAVWDNGLMLLATEVSGELAPGAELTITHTWQMPALVPGPYHFYNHLLLEGNLVAQVDGGSVPHWHWRDGDTLLTYFTLVLPDDLPPGDYALRVGMYTWPDLQRVRLTTGEDGFDAYVATY